MNRREFFRKSGAGITGALTSQFGFSTYKKNREINNIKTHKISVSGKSPNFEAIRIITARRKKKGHVRVSPHFYNNEEDIEVFMRAFSSI